LPDRHHRQYFSRTQLEPVTLGAQLGRQIAKFEDCLRHDDDRRVPSRQGSTAQRRSLVPCSLFGKRLIIRLPDLTQGQAGVVIASFQPPTTLSVEQWANTRHLYERIQTAAIRPAVASGPGPILDIVPHRQMWEQGIVLIHNGKSPSLRRLATDILAVPEDLPSFGPEHLIASWPVIDSDISEGNAASAAAMMADQNVTAFPAKASEPIRHLDLKKLGGDGQSE